MEEANSCQVTLISLSSQTLIPVFFNLDLTIYKLIKVTQHNESSICFPHSNLQIQKCLWFSDVADNTVIQEACRGLTTLTAAAGFG